MEFLAFLAKFLTLFAIWYPSFSMYTYRVFRKRALIERAMQYFIVMTLYLAITFFLDPFMTHDMFYNLVKLFFIVWLIYDHFAGANWVYKRILEPMALGADGQRPFLMQFATAASTGPMSEDAQILVLHLAELFAARQQEIYNMIDSE